MALADKNAASSEVPGVRALIAAGATYLLRRETADLCSNGGGVTLIARG
jgi:hypothetical protein